MTTSLAPSGDLASSYQILAALLALVSVLLLALELRRSRGSRIAVFVTGALAAIGLLGAVLRPVTIERRRARSICPVRLEKPGAKKLRWRSRSSRSEARR
jgi:hypothetical protein